MENNSKSSVVYQGKIPGKVKYSFAFGALGKDLIYGMIATFSMIYFTDIIKVAPAFIGTMFFVAKIWDAFNDLFMGMVVDNTRSRFGKFVPWLVIGTLINAFVFVIVFTDFHLSGISLCVFASVVYVLWGMTYTIMDIPYWSVIPNSFCTLIPSSMIGIAASNKTISICFLLSVLWTRFTRSLLSRFFKEEDT